MSLVAVRADGDGPAVFLPTAPDGLRGDPERVPELVLAPGHKVVFWDFGPDQSLVCGTPPGTEMVCVLKSPQENGRKAGGSPVAHGFVVAAPESRVF